MSYYLPHGEVIKQWLFEGRSSSQWWKRRSSRPVPPDLGTFAEACSLGLTKPTAEIEYEREGAFNKVTREVVGNFNPKVGEFLTEVQEVFGSFTVIKVVS